MKSLCEEILRAKLESVALSAGETLRLFSLWLLVSGLSIGAPQFILLGALSFIVFSLIYYCALICYFNVSEWNLQKLKSENTELLLFEASSLVVLALSFYFTNSVIMSFGAGIWVFLGIIPIVLCFGVFLFQIFLLNKIEEPSSG